MEGIAEYLAEQGNSLARRPYDQMNDHLPRRKQRVKAANKKSATDIRTVATICQAYGYDPIEAVVEALQGNELTLGEKVRTAMGLAEYIHPKLGRTELTGANGGPVAVHTIERRIIDPKD